jgi:hypothetical protein
MIRPMHPTSHHHPAEPSSGGLSLLDGRRRTDLERALTVAKWTDRRFIDPLVGLVLPGLGDVLGATAGLYIVAVAVRHHAPRALVARMLVNLSIDCLGGVIPVVGDLFDALNRANVRNVRLLQGHLSQATPSTAADVRPRALVAPVALLAAAIAVALGAAYFLASRWTHG